VDNQERTGYILARSRRRFNPIAPYFFLGETPLRWWGNLLDGCCSRDTSGEFESCPRNALQENWMSVRQVIGAQCFDSCLLNDLDWLSPPPRSDGGASRRWTIYLHLGEMHLTTIYYYIPPVSVHVLRVSPLRISAKLQIYAQRPQLFDSLLLQHAEGFTMHDSLPVRALFNSIWVSVWK
jgi:hypothetical protein